MQIFNLSTIKKFIVSFRNLDFSHQLLAISYMLLAIMYPGHNSLQTLIITPGPVQIFQYNLFDYSDYPQSDNTPPPTTSAYGIIVQDVQSSVIMHDYGLDRQLLPASTTKLMTALVALDEYELDEVITITTESGAIGHTMGLISGEEITISSLLYGLLVESGNDAALALANYHPDGYTGFVQAMNEMAVTLHLTNTSYRNPSGVESYSHFTTARDLATLATHALKNETIRSIVNTTSITISDIHNLYSHSLTNTNLLLGELDGVQGVKTGWTQNAGECLITYVERDGRGVVIVVLGSTDRFGDTERLVNWIYDHHTWVKII